jgi:hypothetical protein
VVAVVIAAAPRNSRRVGIMDSHFTRST